MVKKVSDFLKEEWIKSSKSYGYGSYPIKIFKNPTAKELKECEIDTRGWVSNRGIVYIGSHGIHHDIARIIKDDIDKNSSVPILIMDRTNKKTDIAFGDAIQNTKYEYDYESATKILKASLWIKKMYPNATITGDMY